MMRNRLDNQPMPFISADLSGVSTGGHQSVLYRNQIPAFVPDWLGKCYGSLYGVLPALHALEQTTAHGIYTYVRQADTDDDALPAMVLMFRRDGRSARVLNEGLHLDRASVDTFCAHVFEAIPEVMQVDFHAIAPLKATPMQGVLPHHPRPCLSWPCTEDIVIHLPDSAEAYLGLLGKATRRSMKKTLSRARRELTNFSHQIIAGAALGENLVHQIVAMNHARMSAQGRDSALDESAVLELIKLIRSHGEAGVIVNGTRLCAGTLACRFGDDVFSLVNAHDPAFDPLGLGSLCRHLMILQAIKAGARRFHLMGGNWSAKRATLAKRQPLHHVTVYRSRRAVLRDLIGLARHTGKAWRCRLRCWLEDQLASAPMGWTARTVSALRKHRRRHAPRSAPTAAERETHAISPVSGRR